MNKLTIYSLGILLIALLALSSCNTVEPGGEVQAETIKVGFIGPLTGGLASIGVDIKNSMELYLSENPVWAAKKVEIVYEDDACDPSKSVSAANKLISSDKVELIMMQSCSGAYLSVAPIANQNGVVIFSSLSTSPEITTASGDYGFRNAPSDDLASTVLIDYIDGKYTKIAILSENTDFSQAYRANIKNKAAEKGIEVVIDEVFNPDTTDFKTALTKLKEAQPEIIFNLSNSGIMAGLISKQKYELGIDVPELGTDVMTATEYSDTAQQAAEGIIIAVTSADESSQAVQDYLSKYQLMYNQAPASPAYAILGWDGMAVIQNAIDAVGYDASAIKDWLYAMPEYNGIAGPLVFDANGDGSILPNLMIFQDGKFEVLKQ